jgi:hypothetical protein
MSANGACGWRNNRRRKTWAAAGHELLSINNLELTGWHCHFAYACFHFMRPLGPLARRKRLPGTSGVTSPKYRAYERNRGVLRPEVKIVACWNGDSWRACLCIKRIRGHSGGLEELRRARLRIDNRTYPEPLMRQCTLMEIERVYT